MQRDGSPRAEWPRRPERAHAPIGFCRPSRSGIKRPGSGCATRAVRCERTHGMGSRCRAGSLRRTVTEHCACGRTFVWWAPVRSLPRAHHRPAGDVTVALLLRINNEMLSWGRVHLSLFRDGFPERTSRTASLAASGPNERWPHGRRDPRPRQTLSRQAASRVRRQRYSATRAWGT